MKPAALKPLLLAPWLLALGALLQALAVGLGLAVGQAEPAGGASLAWAVIWALAAALWWVFHGPRLCNLASSMVTLQLPGTRVILLRGVGMHMALSSLTPLLCLLAWPPAEPQTAQLASAVWLGSCYGLLLISLPWTMSFVPVMLLSLYWPVLADPALSGILGAIALILAGSLWHWQSRRPRPALLAPLGVALDTCAVGLLSPLQERLTPTVERRSTAHAHPDVLRQARMAAVLGRSCQTLTQIYGRRGQALAYLSLAGLLAFCYWLRPGYDSSFIALWVAVAMVWIPQQPVVSLIDLHSRQRAVLAHLLLAPGLPSREHLQATLMRQLRACMLERQIVLTLVVVAMGSNNQQPGLHQPLPALAFGALMLAVNLGLARLAWQGALSRKQLALGTAAAMLLIYLCTLMLRNS